MSGMTDAAHAVALWAGLNLLLLFCLSVLVVRQRLKHKVNLGDGGVPGLLKAQRAFGNACEYVPPALIALIVLALVNAPALLIHAIGGTLFAGRLAHGFGLSRHGGQSAGRSLGMALTWLAWLVAAAALLWFALPELHHLMARV